MGIITHMILKEVSELPAIKKKNALCVIIIAIKHIDYY